MDSTQQKITTTKDKILEVAIDLFAAKGFDTVTIREIARDVGIKGSSIYNHFQSKNDILEKILEYHKSQLSTTYFAEKTDEETENTLQNASLKEMLLDLLIKSLQNLHTPKLQKILKILSQEQLNNDTIRNYFYNDYILEARRELQRRFDKLLEKGLINYPDTEFLANEFHAYVIYKYYENILLKREYEIDVEELRRQVVNHIEFFCKTITSY